MLINNGCEKSVIGWEPGVSAFGRWRQNGLREEEERENRNGGESYKQQQPTLPKTPSQEQAAPARLVR